MALFHEATALVVYQNNTSSKNKKKKILAYQLQSKTIINTKTVKSELTFL